MNEYFHPSLECFFFLSFTFCGTDLKHARVNLTAFVKNCFRLPRSYGAKERKKNGRFCSCLILMTVYVIMLIVAGASRIKD